MSLLTKVFPQHEGRQDLALATLFLAPIFWAGPGSHGVVLLASSLPAGIMMLAALELYICWRESKAKGQTMDLNNVWSWLHVVHLPAGICAGLIIGIAEVWDKNLTFSLILAAALVIFLGFFFKVAHEPPYQIPEGRGIISIS